MADFRDLTLYVVRHGECEHNVQGRYAGTDDTPLTPAGQAQARANGALLGRVAGDLAALDFFASPLHRACATMELVRAVAGLSPFGYRADRRLMELDYGDHSGRPIDAVRARPEFAAYTDDPWGYVRPGGEGLAALHARVGAFLATLRRDSVIVGHAGSVRMLRGHLLGLGRRETWPHPVAQSCILRYQGGRETVLDAAA